MIELTKRIFAAQSMVGGSVLSSKKKSSSKKTNIQKTIPGQANVFAIIPILLIASIVPLIIYIKVTQLNAVESLVMGSNGKAQTDMFSYYKMVWFLVFSAVSIPALALVRNINLFEKPKNLYYIPAGIYALFLLISSIAAEYKSTAFFGFWGRYEGAFVLIAYIAVMFVAMNVFRDEKNIKILFIGLLGSAALISLLGVLQLAGIDYFKSNFVLNIITPSALKNRGGHMEATFGTGTLFSTLYNPNYVGSYMAMLLPIIIVFIVYLKKITHKLVLIALLCLVAICWIGCDSRAGIVGGIVAFVIILVMFRGKIFQHKIVALSVVAVLFIGIFAANLVTNGSIADRIKRLASFESKDQVAETQNDLDKVLAGLDDISVSAEKTRIVTEKGTLQVTMSDNSLKILDENNKVLNSNVNDNIVSFSDSRFTNIKLGIKPEEGKISVFYNEYNLISIVFTKEGFKSDSNIWMTWRGGRSIETFGPERFESFGSNRGYIWSRTVPVLKKAILLGYGPDTFPIYFPQYDYLGKLRNYGVGGMFVDKAHNMYLQTAMNSGVISLLALLSLFGIYFVSSIRLFIREKFEAFLPCAGLACFTAFCGYVFAGLFNDSTISVAPVFWVIFGLGIGINLKLAKDSAIISGGMNPLGKLNSNKNGNKVSIATKK
jgi:hypothetical protein